MYTRAHTHTHSLSLPLPATPFLQLAFLLPLSFSSLCYSCSFSKSGFSFLFYIGTRSTLLAPILPLHYFYLSSSSLTPFVSSYALLHTSWSCFLLPTLTVRHSNLFLHGHFRRHSLPTNPFLSRSILPFPSPPPCLPHPLLCLPLL